MLVNDRNHTITITTHPRRKLNKWSIIRDTLINPYILQSCINTTQKFGHTLPNCFMKVAHPCSHFILGCWSGSPDFISTESSLDLHEQKQEKKFIFRKIPLAGASISIVRENIFNIMDATMIFFIIYFTCRTWPI